MGNFASTALAETPDTKPPAMPNFSFAASAAGVANSIKESEPVDYLNLQRPLAYEDIQRESTIALKPDLFEGFRFEINKPLNQNFFLSHNLFMGNIELSGGRQVLKTPVGTYEFGANVINDKYMLLARLGTDGRLSGRLKYDVLDWMSMKLQCQLSAGDTAPSQVMMDTDFKGKDWNAQLKLGSPTFLGANYFQSVTPKLALGGELFYLQANLKSGVGFAARHTGDKHVATMQLASTGIVSAQYTHKVSDKVTLASDLLWHLQTREVTATIGYDCILRQCRIRGKADTNGVFSTYLEERVSPGINFVMSAELDHWHSNYKFGFGVVAGE